MPETVDKDRGSSRMPWTAANWVTAVGVGHCIARLLLQKGAEDELAMMRELGARADSGDELRRRLVAGVDTLVELLAPKLGECTLDLPLPERGIPGWPIRFQLFRFLFFSAVSYFVLLPTGD